MVSLVRSAHAFLDAVLVRGWSMYRFAMATDAVFWSRTMLIAYSPCMRDQPLHIAVDYRFSIMLNDVSVFADERPVLHLDNFF
jgi:hypothetical protein